jgi:adenine-specific DNA methylase
MDYAPRDFGYPSTRYSGSKRRLLDWIWEHIRNLKFDSTLDAFGGTASVSLLLKRYGKRVLYNDLLKANQIIGTAIIENSNTTVTEEELNRILEFRKSDYPNLIQREFKGIFFLNRENVWLDKCVTNIMEVRDHYKRAILLASLFQACLAKRPFNLFHRANLYMRTASVERTFYNKTTWDRPFPELVKRYVYEYNKAIFSNGKKNRVIGGFDALSAPNGVDLVYLDPPYFSSKATTGTNYLTSYHFLEGLADYKNWASRIESSTGKIKKPYDIEELLHFSKKSRISLSFSTLLSRFQDNIIVLSYQDEGIPSKEEIFSLLREIKKKVRVFEIEHRHVLSPQIKKELLFVAT